MTSTESAVTASAASGYFSASTPRPMTKTSSKRLKAQLLNGSGLALAATRVPALVTWLPAATVPPMRAMIACSHGRGLAQRGDRDQRAAERADEGVDGVPQRVDPRHLVGDELDGVEHDRGADDPVVVEDRELRRQLDPVEPRGQSEHGHGRVEVDAGGQREAERAAQRGQQSPCRYASTARPMGPCAMSASSRGADRRRSGGRGRRASAPRSPPARRSARTSSPVARSALPLRIASRPPVMATGTIGACAWRAMMKPPFLKGRSSSVRLRVPSGKIRNELPARIDAARDVDRRQRRVAVVALHRHEPAGFHHHAEHRQLAQLGLVEDVQAAMQRPEQHRRVDVALVIGAEDDGAARRHVLAADDPVADAGRAQGRARRRRGRARRARPSSAAARAMSRPIGADDQRRRAAVTT